MCQAHYVTTGRCFDTYYRTCSTCGQTVGRNVLRKTADGRSTCARHGKDGAQCPGTLTAFADQLPYVSIPKDEWDALDRAGVLGEAQRERAANLAIDRAIRASRR